MTSIVVVVVAAVAAAGAWLRWAVVPVRIAYDSGACPSVNVPGSGPAR